MTFDSLPFLYFFGVFLPLYHLCGFSLRLQNVLLLAASYFFYGWWDWRFLGLMTLSSGVDYAAGLWLGGAAPPSTRRRVLVCSLSVNLLILFVFKYFDFFSQSLRTGLAVAGLDVSPPLLDVLLPVGISFYTFQSMSYTIDVYRRDIPAERDPIVFFTFVSLFPQLVAGPIERAGHLIGQIRRPRLVRAADAKEAAWLLAWGFFLKECIADSAAPFADIAFQNGQRSGWMTVLGTCAFALQIYCDFNAYSLIARGTARLMGFDLMWNFNLPYFATSMRDFWRRWHISLSTWLRDYLYIPLGGNQRGPRRTYVNLLATMLIGGLWHGAAWNFVLWGLLHGVALAVERGLQPRWRGRTPPVLGWAMTMTVVLVGWMLFRSRSWGMIADMTTALGDMRWEPRHGAIALSLIVLALPVAIVEGCQYWRRDLLAALRLPAPALAAVTGVFAVLAYAAFDRMQYAFIYFQF